MAIEIKDYKDVYIGRRCIIIGNGPSLRSMELKFLDKYITFGLNKVWLLNELTNHIPTFTVCINKLILEQSSEELLKYPSTKFLADKVPVVFDELPNTHLINTKSKSVFSYDIAKEVCEGSTVTYAAMQIAFYMGFQTVYLIGVDHSFSIPAGVRPNQPIEAGDTDPNHFSAKYFSDGYKWQAPDLASSEKFYRIARDEYLKSGRLIVDATLDGKLQVFPKLDYRRL